MRSIFLLLILILACSKAVEESKILEPMTKELCDAEGGRWNECSSPCLGTNADVCAQICIKACECAGIGGWSCPEGYSCRLSGGIPDELGVCAPES